MLSFSGSDGVGEGDSNGKTLEIKGGLELLSRYFHRPVLVEGDSVDAISWKVAKFMGLGVSFPSVIKLRLQQLKHNFSSCEEGSQFTIFRSMRTLKRG